MLLPEVLSDMFDWLKIYFDNLVSKYSKKKPKRIVSERQLRRRRTKKAFFMSQQQNRHCSKRFYHTSSIFSISKSVKIKNFFIILRFSRKFRLSNHMFNIGVKLAD